MIEDLDLLRIIVCKHTGPHWREYMGVAWEAMERARSRYDPSRGASWATYVRWRVIGAIRDERLRELGGRRKIVPTFVWLDAGGDDDGRSPWDAVVAPDYVPSVWEAVPREQLDDREWAMIVLMYEHGHSQRETGEALGVSESRVCQLHGRMKRKLRMVMA